MTDQQEEKLPVSRFHTLNKADNSMSTERDSISNTTIRDGSENSRLIRVKKSSHGKRDSKVSLNSIKMTGSEYY